MRPPPPGGDADAAGPPSSESAHGRLARRQFLQLSALGATGVVGIAAGRRKTTTTTKPPARAKRHVRAKHDPPPVNQLLPSGVVIPMASWIIAENEVPGTLDWVCSAVQPDHALEGFASQVSAAVGDDVALFINSVAPAVQVQAYRMGYYQGLGARLVWQSVMHPASVQPPPVVTPGVGIVTCQWQPTMTISITKDWPPGCYLLKLVGSGGQQQFIPLTIRDDTSYAAYVVQNSVTTWQAYNLYGSYSLYYGPSGGRQTFSGRARAVSFDRPYPQTWASGAADFVGNEFPLVFQLERLGADVTYWTDVDLHERPQLLQNHRCLFSMGHDEYWSAPMRDAAAAAVAAGVNLAFLGANACYRQIRLQPTSVGPNRLEVCYKDANEDPMAKQQPALTTVNWNQAPVNNPESLLIGTTYQSVGAQADMVVTDASNWFFDGCNLTDGHVFPQVIVGEFDRYVPNLPGPRNTDVLAHSPVPGQRNWSDVTYYTAPGNGGGVLATGSATFVKQLSTTGLIYPNVVPGPFPGTSDVLNRAMENLYSRFGLGPATNNGPSGGNWTEVYAGSDAAASSAATTNSA